MQINCMGQNRVELLTPALSEQCSNRLSYWPKNKKRERESGLSSTEFPEGKLLRRFAYEGNLGYIAGLKPLGFESVGTNKTHLLKTLYGFHPFQSERR